jgi:hypothetical protein
MSDRLFRLIFVLGAGFNLLVGFIGIFFYEFSVEFFFGSKALTDSLVAAVFFRLFMGAVVVFGVGYYLVSRDLTTNRGIVWLGAASKLLISSVLAGLVIADLASPTVILTIVPDSIFMVLFFVFLQRTRGPRRAGQTGTA